jgi:predicted nucleotide-binding protein
MSEPKMPKFRVLLVDNNPKVLRIWKRSFQLRGYDVVACANKQEAMEIVAGPELNDFDVAVIDQRLEREESLTDDSGVRVAEAIRGVIPVLLMTGHPDKDLLVQASRSMAIMVKNAGPYEAHRIIQDILVHRVFIVHGHDPGALEDVLQIMKPFRIRPIVLQETTPDGNTLIEGIERYSNVSFAVVLVTPDDVGAKAGTEPLELRPRARQNVIFEWGYFAGTLGRERVAALLKPGNPLLELPSDSHGVRYIEMDPAGSWRNKLAGQLQAAGIRPR